MTESIRPDIINITTPFGSIKINREVINPNHPIDMESTFNLGRAYELLALIMDAEKSRLTNPTLSETKGSFYKNVQEITGISNSSYMNLYRLFCLLPLPKTSYNKVGQRLINKLINKENEIRRFCGNISYVPPAEESEDLQECVGESIKNPQDRHDSHDKKNEPILPEPTVPHNTPPLNEYEISRIRTLIEDYDRPKASVSLCNRDRLAIYGMEVILVILGVVAAISIINTF